MKYLLDMSSTKILSYMSEITIWILAGNVMDGFLVSDFLRCLCRWTRAHYIAGTLDSGIQPPQTPITAEPAHGNVMWRDEQGRIISARFSPTSWHWYLSSDVLQEPTQAGHKMQRGDGRYWPRLDAKFFFFSNTFWFLYDSNMFEYRKGDKDKKYIRHESGVPLNTVLCYTSK